MNYFFCTVLHYLGIVTKIISKTGIFPHDQRIRIFDSVREKISSKFSPANPCAPAIVNQSISYANKYQTLDNAAYYEFGVYKGYTIWKMYKQLLKSGYKNPQLYGFDSFKGLPKIPKADDNGEFYEGQFSQSLQSTRENILSKGGNLSNIHLIEGYYDTTLTKTLYKSLHLPPAAIINIDCDLYTSTSLVLDFIKPLLKKNTLLLFDDWNSFGNDHNRGEKRAFNEFIQKHKSFTYEIAFTYCWHGQAMRVLTI